MLRSTFTAACLCLIVVASSYAQTKLVVPAKGSPTVAAGASASAPAARSGALPIATFSASLNSAPMPVSAPDSAASLAVQPGAVSAVLLAAPSAAVLPVASLSARTMVHPSAPAAPGRNRVESLVQGGVAAWGPLRRAEDVVSEPSRRASALTGGLAASAAASHDPEGKTPPLPRPLASRAALVVGTGFLGTASLSLFMSGLGFLVPFLTGVGVLALGLAKFFQSPAERSSATSSAAVASAETASAEASRWSQWIRAQLRTFLAMGRGAKAVLATHARFEGAVGDGSLQAFRDWFASGLRVALYWIPITLLAMLGGSLGSFLKLIGRGVTIGETAVGQQLMERPLWDTFISYLANGAITQIALLGGFFSIVRALLAWAGASSTRAAWTAGALSVAAYAAYMVADGNALWTIMPILAIQAVLIYLYVRSKTLLVPLGVTAIIGINSVCAGLMLALLLHGKFPAIESLPGIPGLWGVLAVLGVTAALFAIQAAKRFYASHGAGFLKAEARYQWTRLAVVGRWWKKSNLEGAPKSPWPALSVGFLWGMPVFLISYLTYWGTMAVHPGHEVIPEILKRTLLMPFLLLNFVFVIGAALEEWMFRQGLFGFLRERFALAKFGLRSTWIAGAALSAFAASSVHLATGIWSMPLLVSSALFALGIVLESWRSPKGYLAAIDQWLAGIKISLRDAWLGAAVLSSTIFSLFHLVSFAPILKALGIDVSPEILPLLEVYSPSWAGSLGRISAGLLLVALYSRSRVLLIGVTAHFTSNLLEAVGLRWGLSWFIAGIVAIFLLQPLIRKPPKVKA
ncbi:MAG: hypothetical protein HYZ74_07345 [Elusimicrobia bacterium]|nr:hypothetical protein [Elusimicrobiota bacterium]